MSPESTVVAGGASDFMTVRHLRLSGDQTEIGRALGAEAAGRHGWRPQPIDPVRGRARRTWFERNWPQHAERVRGIAAALGVDPDRDDIVIDQPSSVPDGSACSAVFCPPSSTVDGGGLVGRNYDFFTMSWAEMVAAFTPDGGAAAPGGTPVASRPYVLTTVPDEGLATTVITMDQFDGATEGVNEAGLSVALLIADITEAKPPAGPIPPQVGINPMHLPRFVLETCRTAEEAKLALLGAKQTNEVNCHYLIADAEGRAFVWERTAEAEHVIEVPDGGPLCVTNHLLSRNPDPKNLPADTEETFQTYAHARTLAERTADERIGREYLEEIMDEVSIPAVPGYPWRTLWRTVIDVREPALETRFYLGEADGAVRRSEVLRFTPR